MKKRWYRKYAARNGLAINEKLEEAVNDGLEKKKEMFGVRYCPCKVLNIPENICPCHELRTARRCHCGLFREN